MDSEQVDIHRQNLCEFWKISSTSQSYINFINQSYIANVADHLVDISRVGDSRIVLCIQSRNKCTYIICVIQFFYFTLFIRPSCYITYPLFDVAVGLVKRLIWWSSGTNVGSTVGHFLIRQSFKGYCHLVKYCALAIRKMMQKKKKGDISLC